MKCGYFDAAKLTSVKSFCCAQNFCIKFNLAPVGERSERGSFTLHTSGGIDANLLLKHVVEVLADVVLYFDMFSEAGTYK